MVDVKFQYAIGGVTLHFSCSIWESDQPTGTPSSVSIMMAITLQKIVSGQRIQNRQTIEEKESGKPTAREVIFWLVTMNTSEKMVSVDAEYAETKIRQNIIRL